MAGGDFPYKQWFPGFGRSEVVITIPQMEGFCQHEA